MLKIISGGQTGADRAGLDAAIEAGVEYGGYCTKGRRSEDGGVPKKYKLTALSTFSYRDRTKRNVEEADATVVFVSGATTPGSKQTLDITRKLRKPLCFINLDETFEDEALAVLREWLDNCAVLGRPIAVLNVAGTRASKAPALAKQVKAVLLRLLREDTTT